MLHSSEINFTVHAIHIHLNTPIRRSWHPPPIPVLPPFEIEPFVPTAPGLLEERCLFQLGSGQAQLPHAVIAAPRPQTAPVKPKRRMDGRTDSP